MAGFNELQARRLHDAVKRIYGEDISLEGVSPELALAVILENDRVDNWWAQGVIRWTTGPVSVAGAAGNVNRMQLQNPAATQGRGLIITVLGIGLIAKVTAGNTVITDTGALIIAGPALSTSLDLRHPLNAPGLLRVVQPTNFIDNTLVAATGIVLDQFRTEAAEDGYSTVVPIIIPPGGRIDIVNQTLAEASTFKAWGYTRQARAEELTV